MYYVKPHTSPMTGAFWWIVCEQGSTLPTEVDGVLYWDDFNDAAFAANFLNTGYEDATEIDNIVFEPHYEYILKLAVEEAEALVNEDDGKPDRNDDSAWDTWHQVHFGRVLTAIDEGIAEELSRYSARAISEICSEVESDIRHGDILGV